MTLKNKRLAQEWFARAEGDLQFAKAGERETEQHHVTCFLCHQAVEKVLKGLTVGAGLRPEKTHSLRVLLARIIDTYPELEFSDRQVRKLDAFYLPSRYPGPIAKDFTAQDAEQAIQIAGQYIKAVKSLA